MPSKIDANRSNTHVDDKNPISRETRSATKYARTKAEGEIAGRSVEVQSPDNHATIAKAVSKVSSAASSSSPTSLKGKIQKESVTDKKNIESGVIEKHEQPAVKESSIAKYGRIFADDAGSITNRSIISKFIELGMSQNMAIEYGVRIAKIIGEIFNGKPYTDEQIDKIKAFGNEPFVIADASDLQQQLSVLMHKNPLFDVDGNVNQPILEKQLKSIQPNGDYIFQSEIDKELEYLDRNVENKLQHAVTKTTFDSLFQLCCDHQERIGEDVVSCITKDTLRLFYKDPLDLLEKIKSGGFPKNPRIEAGCVIS